MSNINKNTDLYDEAVDFVVSYYQDNKLEDDDECQSIVNDIFGLVVKKLDNKIKFCEKCMNEPTTTIEGWDRIQGKIEGFQEIKRELQKGLK